MSPAFIFEGCGTREAVKKFRGHVFPGGFPSQSACFPPSLPPQAFSFSLGAAISWPFITPAPPSFFWSLILQERLFWSAGFPRCWIRSWEVTPALRSAFTKTTFPSSVRRTRSSFPFITAGSTGSPARTGSWPYLPEKISVFPSGIRTAARYGMISAGF